jgi:hypothetical protein
MSAPTEAGAGLASSRGFSVSWAKDGVVALNMIAAVIKVLKLVHSVRQFTQLEFTFSFLFLVLC